jgi:flagellar basal body-associated protein FliL
MEKNKNVLTIVVVLVVLIVVGVLAWWYTKQRGSVTAPTGPAPTENVEPTPAVPEVPPVPTQPEVPATPPAGESTETPTGNVPNPTGE